ncbi:MAG: family 78 glycoside hydrolase catalytic domain [Eisenbergiella sp.]
MHLYIGRKAGTARSHFTFYGFRYVKIEAS